MRRFLVALPFLLMTATASAQHGPNASVEAMKRLGFLVGDWRGKASVMMGPGGAQEAAQHEVIKLAAGGTVLTITGKGTVIDNGAERVVHDAFATLWWDAEANRYRMRAHLATGQAVETEPVVTDSTLVWGFQHPQVGHIRYTISLDGNGDWHEIGERSPDGKTSWMKFIDMRLTRSPVTP